MSKLKLEFRNTKRFAPIVHVNGQPAALTYDRYGNGTCEVEKAECISVELKRIFEESTKAWFWFDLLYFIVSLFGIFDVRRDKTCRAANVSMRLYPNLASPADENVVIRGGNFRANTPAVTVEGTCRAEILQNTFYCDAVAKKNVKIAKTLRTLFWVFALIVGGVTALIVLF